MYGWSFCGPAWYKQPVFQEKRCIINNLQWYRIQLPVHETQIDSWIRKIPWRRKWQPTPVISPGKSHGQRKTVRLQSMESHRVRSYNPWGHKESDMAEQLGIHTQKIIERMEVYHKSYDATKDKDYEVNIIVFVLKIKDLSLVLNIMQLLSIWCFVAKH